MQDIQDLVVQGGNFVYPLFKGVIDLTAAVIPGVKNKEKINGGISEVSGGGKTIIKENSGEGCCGWMISSLAMPTLGRSMIRLSGLSGALAVGLGAYGAHVIMKNDKIPADQKYSFNTANFYHFVGTFGLVAASLSKFPLLTGLLMSSGSILFCGSCYYHGLTGNTKITRFAPIGGTILILAWLSLIL